MRKDCIGAHRRSSAANTVFCCLILALSLPAANSPRRIVSLSPNVTEMLYGIGAFGQVVGVSDYCAYPPEVAKLPSVGGWTNPNLEKLASLAPDLVIIDDGQAPFLLDSLKSLGLRSLTISDHTVADVYRTMEALGKATGHEQEAAKLIASTRNHLERVSQKAANLPRPKVVVILDRTPGTLRDLYTVTGGDYLADLVNIAGGNMALAASKIGYAKLSKEDLLAANPDIILDFVQGMIGHFSADPLQVWQEMPELKAVRTGRVFGVNQDYVPHASQRIVLTAELFLRLIHPEAR